MEKKVWNKNPDEAGANIGGTAETSAAGTGTETGAAPETNAAPAPQSGTASQSGTAPPPTAGPQATDDFLEGIDISREEDYLRKDKRERNLRLALTLTFALCLVVLGVSVWRLLSIGFERQAAKDEYDTLMRSYTGNQAGAGAAGLPGVPGELGELPEGQEEEPLTFAEVQALNSECVAWIEIPGTAVNYPVVRANDNEKYLDHTFLGNKNSAGAIFLDANNSGDFSSPHNIIYGHNMKNGTMFGSLEKYLNADYLAQNPVITIQTGSTTYTYRIFSVRVTDMYDPGYRMGFASTEELSQFSTSYGGPENPSGLLTLSTCTNGADEERLLVVASRES